MSGRDLDQRLLAAGVPVVVVRSGDKPPAGWQTITADRCDLGSYRPGVDALAMPTGYGLDIVDVDTKNGIGGSVDNLPPFPSFGKTTTPSGGAHYVVPSCGLGKISPLRTSLGFVGDYLGGRPDGSGRALVFLPGSTRTKYPNGGYTEEVSWDIEGCLAASPDPALVAALAAAGGSGRHHEIYVDASPERPAADGIHPYAARAIARELARLDECRLLGWAGPPWNNTIFSVSCNMIEFGQSRWTGYTIEAALADLLAHAPMDENFGLREVEACWSSAMNKVGQGGRPYPGTLVEDDFVAPTSTLRHIVQAAHSRLTSAPALLAYLLGRILAEVPAHVTLPPVVGGHASLNLGFAVVGESGGGKSSLVPLSAEVLGLTGLEQRDIERVVGSGEGLVQQYLRWDSILKCHVPISDPRRLMLVDEIDQLGATKSRNGATIASVLRSALTGGPLGQANATATLNRHLPAGSYRLVITLGVQPGRSGILLEDADAGTPQRLVWVSTNDPTIPEEDLPWPGALDWEMPKLPDVIDYPDHIKAEVRAARRQQLRTGADPLQGHRLLTRLKVAAALALLHEEVQITDQWWEMAGGILEMSMSVQDDCRSALAAAGSRKNAERALAAGHAAVITSSIVDEDAAALARASRAILRKVGSAGEEGMPWWEIRLAVQHKDREHALRARDALETTGQIRVEDVSLGDRKGERLWPGE